jgi:replication factor C subunit 3/5
MLETASVTAGGALTAATPIPLMDWERYVQLLAGDVLREQSPRSLLACRARLYELLVNCVPADTIMKRLAAFLVAPADAGAGAGAAAAKPPLAEEWRHEIVHWAAYYEHRLQLGQKELFHLEAFIAKVMAVVRAGPAPGAAPVQ